MGPFMKENSTCPLWKYYKELRNEASRWIYLEKRLSFKLKAVTFCAIVSSQSSTQPHRFFLLLYTNIELQLVNKLFTKKVSCLCTIFQRTQSIH